LGHLRYQNLQAFDPAIYFSNKSYIKIPSKNTHFNASMKKKKKKKEKAKTGKKHILLKFQIH